MGCQPALVKSRMDKRQWRKPTSPGNGSGNSCPDFTEPPSMLRKPKSSGPRCLCNSRRIDGTRSNRSRDRLVKPAMPHMWFSSFALQSQQLLFKPDAKDVHERQFYRGAQSLLSWQILTGFSGGYE